MLSFRGCESFDCSCPTGLTISHHDGRMYISELSHTLTVRQIDGSQSELSLHPGSNKEFFDSIYYARICSDDRIVVQDQSGNLTNDCSCPTGLTISHDGRMYISEQCDTLTVREIDGSQSKLSLRPGPNKEFFHSIDYAQICSDDRIVVQDESGNLIKFSNDGEFIWRIESETTSPTVSFALIPVTCSTVQQATKSKFTCQLVHYHMCL